jgi:alanyl-tRNA synthetase
MRQETKRLYLEDAYRVEFEARIVGKGLREKKPALILDQTYFYPESGGQPYDQGWIDGERVIKVFDEGEKVIHVLEKDIEAEGIKGKIDWERRFDHMQQHSGQHILSQSFVELFGAKTLSFHLGESVSTLEIDLKKASDDEVERVERRANEIVFEDREVKLHFLSEDDVGRLPLRKPPPKKKLIRVVEVSGFDFTACGGTHVGRTGEVGLVKILKWERIRDNVRFEFLCGNRALQDYLAKNRILRELSNRYTVHESEVLSVVEKLSSDLKSQKQTSRKLQQKIAQYEAQEIIKKAEKSIISQTFTDRTHEEVRNLALNIIHGGDFIVLLGLRGEERGHLILARSEGFDIDMRELIPLVSPLIKGKGGGNPSLVELVAEDKDRIDAALGEARTWIEKKILA